MKSTPVTMARIYVTEASGLLQKITQYLEREAKVRGISVFRAVQGFGDSGERSASLLDLSVSLPLVIEFFDEPAKVETALAHLATTVNPAHIVYWSATVIC